jgi:HEPN domain-containing protein
MAAEDMRDDVVGFHAQQAVEKALKVALVLADVDFPRSHDLRELVDIATDNDVAVPDSIEQARWLTPWAAQLRYEMLEPLDRAQRARRAASRSSNSLRVNEMVSRRFIASGRSPSARRRCLRTRSPCESCAFGMDIGAVIVSTLPCLSQERRV